MTTYFHFVFTSLNLARLGYVPSANVTALQVFEPNDTNIRSIFAEFNLKNMVANKPLFSYMPVMNILFLVSFSYFYLLIVLTRE